MLVYEGCYDFCFDLSFFYLFDDLQLLPIKSNQYVIES